MKTTKDEYFITCHVHGVNPDTGQQLNPLACCWCQPDIYKTDVCQYAAETPSCRCSIGVLTQKQIEFFKTVASICPAYFLCKKTDFKTQEARYEHAVLLENFDRFCKEIAPPPFIATMQGYQHQAQLIVGDAPEVEDVATGDKARFGRHEARNERIRELWESDDDYTWTVISD